MKTTSYVITAFMMAIIMLSCKKEGTNGLDGNGSPDRQRPIADSGFVVIYNNDLIYTDPLKGSFVPDKIKVSINNVYKGEISIAGYPVYYRTKNTIGLKLPVGSIAIKATTSSGVVRNAEALIIKNDTSKVKIDYAYNDANSNNYYIEYYDNGVLKRYSDKAALSNWKFYINNHETLYARGCSSIVGVNNLDGPAYTTSLISVPPSNIALLFSRASWKLKPDIGTYTFSSGNLNMFIAGAGVICSKSDSYASVIISEVKIAEDMGFEKRGYYTGTFDAIVYFSPPSFFSTPEKHIITRGKFFTHMGGINVN